MNFWLVKQEPSKYSWVEFVKDKETYWDGVRNYQARNNLQKMKKGDLVMFYHSVVGKEVMGIAKVSKEFYPDPTTALLSSTVHQSCATRQPSCCSPKVSCIHFKTQFQIHPYSIRASKRTSDFEASNLIEHFPPAGQHPQTTAWRELLDESGCLSSRSRENSFPRASILSAAF